MYAIIETGGKQIRVEKDAVIFVEKLEANEGDVVTLDQVLAVAGENGLTVGSPVVEGATVTAKVVAQGKAKKVIVYKYKAKKNYRRTQGHRQPYTKVEITSIKTATAKAKAEA